MTCYYADIGFLSNKKYQLQFTFHNGINIISFSFLYELLIQLYLNKIGEMISQRRGSVFDNDKGDWCMLGRAFLCRTGFQEPGTDSTCTG